jgi:hypothetical protein
MKNLLGFFGEYGIFLPVARRNATTKPNTKMKNTDTKQTKPTFVETTAKFFGITIEQAQAMIDKADARNRATHEKGMSLKESVAQGKFAKGGIWA